MFFFFFYRGAANSTTEPWDAQVGVASSVAKPQIPPEKEVSWYVRAIQPFSAWVSQMKKQIEHEFSGVPGEFVD